MKHRVVVQQWIVIVGCLWGLLYPMEGITAQKPLHHTIERERKTLQELHQKIQKTQKQQEQVLAQQAALLKTIETLDQELVRQQHEYEAINRQLKDADRELARIGEQLRQLRARLTRRRDNVLARLRVLYKEGQAGRLKPLLTARSLADFHHRFLYLSTLARREYALLHAYRSDLETQERLKDQQMRFRTMLLHHKQTTEKALEAMSRIRKKKHAILASLKKQADAQARLLATLQLAESRKEALLRELEQRRQLSEVRRVQKAGSLLWPVEGKVIAYFGRQKHPVFDTYIMRKGIEIQVMEGSAIRAVSSGTVVYADWLKGYGLAIIIDHHNGFYSFYAHASKLLIKKGDTVELGQVIGETGESGLTDHHTLYFELRKGTEPVDPLKWLVKRP